MSSSGLRFTARCMASVVALMGASHALNGCVLRSNNETGLRGTQSESLQTALSILKTSALEELSKDNDLLTKLANASSRVSVDDRKTLSEKVRSMIGSDASKQKVLRVVFDDQEWKRYVTLCATDGLPKVDGYTELSLLPDDIRDMMITTVKEYYADASKGDHSWKTTKVAPKRCLDAILSTQ